MTTEVASSMSQKSAALIALYQLGGFSRDLTSVVDQMRKIGLPSVDVHNVAHVMWPLSKEGLLSFVERKGKRNSSELTRIVITARGVDRARTLSGEEATGRVHQARSHGRAAHAVGKDMTDWSRHSSVAEGGPIERRIEKETVLDSVPFVVLNDVEAAAYRTTPPKTSENFHRVMPVEKTVEPPKQNERIVTDVKVTTTPVRKNTSTTRKDVDANTPTEYPDRVAQAERGMDQIKRVMSFQAGDYPQIAAVMAKQEKIDRYTRAAELLGDDEADIAVQLLDKVKISPLEEEIIRLLG